MMRNTLPVAPVQRFVRPASQLMCHPHRIRLVANNVNFDAKRNRRNGRIPVASFVEFGEYDKPSQVTLVKWIACGGSFPFHYIDRLSVVRASWKRGGFPPCREGTDGRTIRRSHPQLCAKYLMTCRIVGRHTDIQFPSPRPSRQSYSRRRAM